jgi:hypothetical protein
VTHLPDGSRWPSRLPDPAQQPRGGWGAPPNKGMKLTKPERIGALQLIPGVSWLVERGEA